MNNSSQPNPNPRRLYRDTENAMLAGVLAGIADYFGFSLKALRWLVFLGCAFMMPAICVSYLVAAFLLPAKPVGLYRNEGEESFWRSVRRDPHYACDDIRRKFRDLDGRLQGMEHYVTSPRFDLDQEFKNL
ncbi:MAG: envelope stress response membrane protein PspC [Gammaproteobacteria bacterium]|jgi:phage shock protein C|nr:envelope stress response membrane protein PspC [Chromatiales bacterium]MDP6674989.1 envelope stress response membrane protein PspC [Gammaproteobacteria bacterium]